MRVQLLLFLSVVTLAACSEAESPAQDTHPIQGKWYNSYCSQMELTASENTIDGYYSSDTGAVGTYRVVGQYFDSETGKDKDGFATGITFSMSIQWRNVGQSEGPWDSDQHWVAGFAGQYHPKQRISHKVKDVYEEVPETLEILNMLIATAAPLVPFTNTSPVYWPQTLRFHRDMPIYCKPFNPNEDEHPKGTAKDLITGTWKSPLRETMTLSADLNTGIVVGSYTDPAEYKYAVIGAFDILAPPEKGYTVTRQGLTLTLRYVGADKDDSVIKLKTLSGGVDYLDTEQLYLVQGDLKTTNWTYRFTQQRINRQVWKRQ